MPVLEVLLILAGALLVCAVFVDAVMTTMIVSAKAGFLTRHVTGTLWRALRATARRPRLQVLLRAGGAAMVAATILTWLILLWAGFMLLFSAGEAAVVQSQTDAPATHLQRLYFVGFTLSTLGIGDFVASSDGWRLLTSFASFCGLILVTLAITYLLSVVSAVVGRRSMASHVHSLGQTPGAIVAAGWDGSSFSSAFVQHLVSLTSEIGTLAEQDLAYPVLGFFRSGTPLTAAPVAIANLSEAVVLLQSAVAPDARPATAAVKPIENAIGRHLQTSDFVGTVRGDVPTPAAPDRRELREAGIPLVEDKQFMHDVALQAERRRAAHRLVLSGGWSWLPQQ